jgi:hypothetical protein
MIRTQLYAAAPPSPKLRSEEPIGLCLTLDDARVVLEHWQSRDERLGFSFFHAAASALRAGQAAVARVGARLLTLDTRDRRFVVAIENACIEFTQAEFSRPGFKTIDVEGLSVLLANDDWLFLFQEMTSHARYSRYSVRSIVAA